MKQNKLVEALEEMIILALEYDLHGETVDNAKAALQEHAANKEEEKEKTLTEHWGIKTAANKEGTVEEIAQWVISNRYPKSEFDKLSDHELYYGLIGKIKALPSPPKPQP